MIVADDSAEVGLRPPPQRNSGVLGWVRAKNTLCFKCFVKLTLIFSLVGLGRLVI